MLSAAALRAMPAGLTMDAPEGYALSQWCPVHAAMLLCLLSSEHAGLLAYLCGQLQVPPCSAQQPLSAMPSDLSMDAPVGYALPQRCLVHIDALLCLHRNEIRAHSRLADYLVWPAAGATVLSAAALSAMPSGLTMDAPEGYALSQWPPGAAEGVLPIVPPAVGAPWGAAGLSDVTVCS